MSSEQSIPSQESISKPQGTDADQLHLAAAIAIPHLTAQERANRGKAARKSCPRSVHAVWNPPDDRLDPITLLEAQAETRVPDLIPIRYRRMLVSPFAFYRGAAVIMASDLSSLPNTGLRVQLCGDAHLSNFGGFASPERKLVLDLNDFDETLPGPWEWDLKRLAASVEIAGRERGFAEETNRRLVIGTVAEYRRAMKEFAAVGNLDLWYMHMSLAGMKARWGKTVKRKTIKKLDAHLERGQHRDNQRALEKLTRRIDGRLQIAPSPPLVVPIEDLVSADEKELQEEMLRKFMRNYRAKLRGDMRRLTESYHYVHLARKVVGVGSVGTLTWVVLLLGRDETDPLFLQVKEAKASVLEPYLGKSAYANHGRRVVEGQWLMQASSDIFLGWDRVEHGYGGLSHDFYVRQLWDWKVSLDVETIEPEAMMVYMKLCAWTLARAHARSGDRIAIDAYLGKKDRVDHALAEFAAAYADQNERDYQSLVAAAESGRIKVEAGV